MQDDDNDEVCCNFSTHRNVIKKESKKILKYKDLIRENQSMWNVKAKEIPVITGATGTFSQ